MNLQELRRIQCRFIFGRVRTRASWRAPRNNAAGLSRGACSGLDGLQHCTSTKSSPKISKSRRRADRSEARAGFAQRSQTQRSACERLKIEVVLAGALHAMRAMRLSRQRPRSRKAEPAQNDIFLVILGATETSDW
jgi:hypothetical protein